MLGGFGVRILNAYGRARHLLQVRLYFEPIGYPSRQSVPLQAVAQPQCSGPATRKEVVELGGFS